MPPSTQSVRSEISPLVSLLRHRGRDHGQRERSLGLSQGSFPGTPYTQKDVVRDTDVVKIRFLSCQTQHLWSWRFPQIIPWAKGKAGHSICLQTLDKVVSAIAFLYLALNSCLPAKWKIRVCATKRIHLIPPIKSSLWSVKLVPLARSVVVPWRS